MKMNPEEITAIIKDQIKNYNVDLNVDDVGTVIEIGDGIAHIHGLDKAMSGELLDFGNDIYGMVLNLEQDNVGAVLLGGDTKIKEGDIVKRTGKIMQVPVGESMIGVLLTHLVVQLMAKALSIQHRAVQLNIQLLVLLIENQ